MLSFAAALGGLLGLAAAPAAQPGQNSFSYDPASGIAVLSWRELAVATGSPPPPRLEGSPRLATGDIRVSDSPMRVGVQTVAIDTGVGSVAQSFNSISIRVHIRTPGF